MLPPKNISPLPFLFRLGAVQGHLHGDQMIVTLFCGPEALARLRCFSSTRLCVHVGAQSRVLLRQCRTHPRQPRCLFRRGILILIRPVHIKQLDFFNLILTS